MNEFTFSRASVSFLLIKLLQGLYKIQVVSSIVKTPVVLLEELLFSILGDSKQLAIKMNLSLSELDFNFCIQFSMQYSSSSEGFDAKCNNTVLVTVSVHESHRGGNGFL